MLILVLPLLVQASVQGDLQVLFYGEQAGSSSLGPVSLPARAYPKARHYPGLTSRVEHLTKLAPRFRV
jgi:hypothetical protein